jgi:hypothetical protein
MEAQCGETDLLEKIRSLDVETAPTFNHMRRTVRRFLLLDYITADEHRDELARREPPLVRLAR